MTDSSSLKTLHLHDNDLTSVLVDLFDGLSSLKNLQLNRNDLTSVPEDLLDGLSSLRALALSGNDLTDVPEDLFDGLSSLDSLYLHDNDLTSVPEDLFDGLSSLKRLWLYDNDLTSVPEDLFDGPANLEGLWLHDNDLTGLPEGLFDHKDGNPILPVTLWNNPIECLPSTILDNPYLKLSPAKETFKVCNAPLAVTLALSSNPISENGGSTTVTATLNQASNAETTVTISATPQSPAASSDYELSTNITLTIAAGATTSTGTVTITAVDNDRDEPDKTITVSGSVPDAQGVTNPPDLTLTIEDDEDAPTVTLDVSPTSISENGGSTTVTATLDHASTAATTVTISVTPVSPATSSDYELSTNTTLTIAAGATSSTGTVKITAVDNDRDEPDKTITVSGTYLTPTPPELRLTSVTLTIEDDEDEPTVTLDVSPKSISENGGSTAVTATLDHASIAATTVTISATPQSPATSADYKLSTTTMLTIAAGATTSTGTVMITAVDNDRDEPDKTITVSGSAANSQGITSPSDVTLTITDDDKVAITAPASVPVTEGSSTDFPVALSSQPTGTVTVTVTGHSGTDLTPNPLVLTFTDRNWSASQPVHLTAAEDGDVADDQVTLTLTASDGGYTGVTHSVTVTITDNDVARLEVRPTSVSVNEGASVTFTVNLLTEPEGTVTVRIPTFTNPNLTHDQPTLTFTRSNHRVAQTVTVSAAEDANTVNESESIRLTASGGSYSGATQAVRVTVIDNDIAGIELVPSSLSVTEGSAETYSVRLLSEPSEPVTINIVESGGNVTVSPLTLHFAASNWDEAQQVTVRADLDDNSTNETSTLIHTATSVDPGYSGTTANLPVTVIDQNLPRLEVTPNALTIDEGSSAEFTVELTSKPTADVTVQIADFTNLGVTHDQSMLTFTPLTWNAPQAVTVTAAEDANTVDESESITLTASGAGSDGSTETVTVTVIDNDLAGIELVPSSLNVTEGSAETYSVRLLSEPVEPVIINIVETGGNVTMSPRTLYFAASNWDEAQQVTVQADLDDNSINETSTLIHTAISVDQDYSGTTAILPVTVLDRDVPHLVVTPGVLTMDEGTSAEFTVKLASEPTIPVAIEISDFTNPDLTHDQPTLAFTASTWDEPQVVTVSAAADDDAEDEAPESLILRASGVEYDGVTGAVTVTVKDTDRKGILLNPLSLELEEGGPASTYTVELQSAPTSDVTVTITGPSAEVTLDRASLTFTPATWDTPQTVTVQAPEDEDTDNEQFTLAHSARGGGYDHETAHLEIRINDSGEVLLSIYDAQVEEGDGHVDLRVELNQPADQLVSVMYRAEAEDAEAGSDYEDSRGIVLFNPGSTKGKIRLDILEDEIPESDETFTVVLSNARNAVIARETGRVTIVDGHAGATVRIDDGVAFEEDGRIRFTVHLSQPSETPVTVSYRTENGTATAGEDYEAASGVLTFAPGVVQEEIAVELLTDELDWRQETFTVHLQSLGKTRIEKAVAVATIREKTSVRSGVLKAYTARFVRTSTIQIVDALHQRFRSRTDATSCSAAQRAVMAQVWGATTGWDPSPGELLAGCHVSRGMGGLSAWGRGAFTRFNGRGKDALRIRADVTTAMVGTDYRWRRGWLAGLLVSHSQGDGSFRGHEASGAVQSGLTGVVPYVSVQGTDWGVWMAAGYGRGRTEVEELEGDLASTFGAAGVQGEWASNAAFGLTVHGDVLVAGAEVDAHAVRAQIYRMRAGLGGDLRISDVIRPYVEANVRQDGGSAETGTGLELGGGVRLSYPAWRLKGEMRTQGLVIHSADGFTEWGLSGLVQVGNGPEGLVVSVRPSWGPQKGGVLQRQHLDVTPAGGNLHRTAMEMAYGVPLKAGMMRSVAGVAQLSTGRIYRLGTELRPRDYMSVSVYGMVYTHANAPTGIGLNLQGSVRY